MKFNQKPCRHFASISLNSLSLHLSQTTTSHLNYSECDDSSCKNSDLINNENIVVYTCLTCLRNFCHELTSPLRSNTHLIHHAKTQKHPLSFNAASSSSDTILIENEFHCAICAGHPKIRSSQDRITLEKIKSLILENQKNSISSDVCILNNSEFSNSVDNQNYKINNHKHSKHSNSLKKEKSNTGLDSGTSLNADSVRDINDNSDDVPKGLINLGNTCFMNSALQLLAATLKRHGDLKTEFDNYLSSTSSNLFSSLLYHLKGIYENVNTKPNNISQTKSSKSLKKQQKSNYSHKNSNLNSLNPKEFLSILSGQQKKFSGLQQQDAHDFLRLLFNSLSLNSNNSSDDNLKVKVVPPQVELFGGKFVSRVICEGCKKVSDTSEPFLDISLSLPPQSSSSPSLESSIQNLSLLNSEEDDKKSSLNLNKLLMNWNKKIRLEGENGYYCEFCATQQDRKNENEENGPKQLQLQTASLQYFLSSTPPFLILHLQRFKTFLTSAGSRGNKSKSKSSKGRREEEFDIEISKDRRAVQFPLDLSLPPNLLLSNKNENNPQYRLYGYIIHEGSSTITGHYTAIICTQKSNRWFYISDSSVKEISEKDALAGDLYPPYLLFYQKVNM